MQTRRDQVQAHLFVMNRLAAGLLRNEPDLPEAGTGRTTKGTVIGVVLAAVIAAVVAIFGLIVPGGSQTWRVQGAVVLVKDTGSRYLFLSGVLHPLLNETSAHLVDGSQFTIQAVTAASLDGVPRGGPVGIVGAPDLLPAAKVLGSGPWLVCGSTTASGPELALSVGPADLGQSLTAGEATLVAAPDGSEQLLWQGHRLRLDNAHQAAQALGYANTTPVPVEAGLINALPPGPDLSAPDVPGRGRPGPALAARPTVLGQLFASPSGQRYLLRSDGLLALTDTQFALLSGDPRTQQAAYGGAAVLAAPIGPADIAAHQVAGATQTADSGTGQPVTPPTLVQPAPNQAACAVVQPHGTAPETAVSVISTQNLTGQAPLTQPGVVPSCTPITRIEVPAGRGALVHALSTGGGVAATTYLVGDSGVKYPLPNVAAVKQLGYDPNSAVGLPADLLSLLPTGPSLDPAALTNTGVAGTPIVAGSCSPE